MPVDDDQIPDKSVGSEAHGPDADKTTTEGRRQKPASGWAGILDGPGKAMTETEQRIGRLLALGSSIFFIALHQPWAGGDSATFAAFGVGLSALLWLASRHGNRIVTAVASYGVFFGPWGELFIVAGIPIGFAFLLGFRSSKEAGQARAAARAANRSSNRSAPQKRSRRPKKKKADEPTRPSLPVTEANRRYTPPKPKRKNRY
ncbi:MAG: hypothetical protein ACR2H3_14290 [Acidimicrobiales bacterium]